jgi:hypothetical protein
MSIVRMRDIKITGYMDCDFNDIEETNDYILDKLIEYYNIYHIPNVEYLWYNHYVNEFVNFDEDYDDEEDIININDRNLSIVKLYEPEIYENKKYDFNVEYPKYPEEYKNIYDETLKESAKILKFHLQKKFSKYINDLEGDELSDADTETDE